MNTTIVNFEKFNGIVKFSNIQLFPNMLFTLDLQIKEEGKRNFSKVIPVTGRYTYPVLNWFNDLHKVNVKIVDNTKPDGFRWETTGESRTKFQSYLVRHNLPTSTQLKDLAFQSHGHSENFDENPFRLVLYKNRPATLTMVHVAPKKRFETIDSNGEVQVKYTNKETINVRGRVIPKPLDKSQFRRLLIEHHEVAEVFQD